MKRIHARFNNEEKETYPPRAQKEPNKQIFKSGTCIDLSFKKVVGNFTYSKLLLANSCEDNLAIFQAYKRHLMMEEAHHLKNYTQE